MFESAHLAFVPPPPPNMFCSFILFWIHFVSINFRQNKNKSVVLELLLQLDIFPYTSSLNNYICVDIIEHHYIAVCYCET